MSSINLDDVNIRRSSKYLNSVEIQVPDSAGNVVYISVIPRSYGNAPSVVVDTHKKPEPPPVLPDPELVEVGVMFEEFNSPKEAAMAAVWARAIVYTYDALKSLNLTIGDRVECAIGTVNGPTTGYRTATVVTLDPKPAPCAKRIITSFAVLATGCGNRAGVVS